MMSRAATAVGARRAEGATDIWTADDLATLRRPRFFFSDNRVRLRAPAFPVAAAGAVEARLGALQSICGCTAAALGLVAGGGIAWWLGASAWAVVGYGFGAAVIAKVCALSTAYAAFALQVSLLRRALRDAEARTDGV